MSRYDDRGRPRHDRDVSPDYAFGGSGTGSGVRVPSPGHTSYYPSPRSQARIEYEPQTPFYPPPPSGANLQVPDSRLRPRSLPPTDYRRSRSYHDSGDDDEPVSRARTPVAKARQVLGNTFTDSTTGLGVGVVGALLGGLAAHEAAEATSSSSSKHHASSSEAQRRNQLLSTVVGAAVGALGANAVEKRIEVNRERGLREQERWEQKWGKKPSSNHRRGSDARADYIERREVVTSPSSGSGGWKRDWRFEDEEHSPRRSRGRGVEREVDPDARSWKNVEDWVYDERDPSRDRDRDRRGRRSEDGYRY